jgi:hypothetical protein
MAEKELDVVFGPQITERKRSGRVRHLTARKLLLAGGL